MWIYDIDFVIFYIISTCSNTNVLFVRMPYFGTKPNASGVRSLPAFDASSV